MTAVLRRAGIWLALAGWTAQPALACSCMDTPSPLLAMEQANAVFTGIVAGGGSIPHQKLALFYVDQTWKGVDSYDVVVATPAHEAACGVPFAPGRRYVVYASRDPQGRLHTTLCSRTREMGSLAKEEDLEATGFPPIVKMMTPTHFTEEQLGQALQFPGPLWFAQGQERGLRQTSEGQLFRGTTPLRIEPGLPALAAAAYYPQRAALITVGLDGTVTWYDERDGRFAPGQAQSPSRQAIIHEIRWTRVPGLLYLLMIPKEPAPDEPTVYRRVTLTAEAAGWQALPVDDPQELLLGGCYTRTLEGIWLSLQEGRWLAAELSQPVDEPFRTGPYDPLAQAVFVLPDRRLLIKTLGGWSLHQADGSPQRAFSTEQIEVEAWDDPSSDGLELTVRGKHGERRIVFQFDVDAGSLTPVAWE